MEERAFVFIKDYPIKGESGVVNEGRELRFFRGGVYLDGGMLPPSYHSEFKRLVANDKERNEYLREIRIIKDKV